ncbi:MAG: DivIVA domain-containing protein [Acidobacteria bacterium]|nr:DivIVA domain-containing protein [Acidobacteriota bacterium]
MTDLTPRDVRQKNREFRRVLWGYDQKLVDAFLEVVAQRLGALIKQNIASTDRADTMQKQIAAFRERETAINETMVAALQLQADARTRVEHEAEPMRTKAQGEAERILGEGQRTARNLTREIEGLTMQRSEFVKAFRSLLEQYLAEVEEEEGRVTEAAERPGAATRVTPGGAAASESVAKPPDAGGRGDGPGAWLSSILGETENQERR